MNRKLYVWVRGADNTIRLAGELGSDELSAHNGRFRAEFEYSREWTADRGGFALDPQSLPLGTDSRRFGGDMLYPPLGVFEDALPDDWGRSLLRTALRQEGRKVTQMEMLLRMRGGGPGALLFTEVPEAPRPLHTASGTALPALLSAAEQFEAGTLPPGDEFRRLLEGSSRAGGARPKALVHDGTAEWLVKFPSRSRDESHDVVGLEAVCMALARQAGLEVPETRLLTLGQRRALMVRRFDVTPAGGRHHMVSLSTLGCERPGIHVTTYGEVARIASVHSEVPAQDVAALFRHMIFNAAIGNVDDHLKNFWMLGGLKGYRLAPAFDLVPDITGRIQHTLLFGSTNYCPTRLNLAAIANQWNVLCANEIIDRVAEAANGFAAMVNDLEVEGGENLKRILEDVSRRIETLTSKSW